ncbi:MAG: uncharacterized protein JWM98_3383 [Thermoleophilia bacterium]|nr:uncharacterized protein [Thermoleophilia bacterium]
MRTLRPDLTVDAPVATTIPIVQGAGAASPLAGQVVTVAGIVTGIARTGSGAGFFLQDPVGDGDAATSDALFVRAGDRAPGWGAGMSIGSKATVTGVVGERGGMTSIALAAAAGVIVAGHVSARAAIVPEALDVPMDPAARTAYLEAREGMVVALPDALVVGATNVYGQAVVMDAGKQGMRRMRSTPDRTGYIHVNGKLGPQVPLVVGDRIGGLKGPLGVTNGNFEIEPIGSFASLERGAHAPLAFGDLDGDDRFTATDRAALLRRVGEVAAGPLDAADLDGNGMITRADLARLDARMARVSGGPVVRIATLNAFNFFDPDDAPSPIQEPVVSPNEYRTKLAKMAGTVRDRLGAPELVAMQEVENTRVLDDLLARPELRGLGYRYVLLPTNGARSINPALLYRGDGIEVLGARQLQRTPVRRSEESVFAPVRAAGASAEGPLFAREPLAVDLRIAGGAGEEPRELTVIVNHLISKFSPHGLPTEPIRVAQAEFLRGEVERMRAEHPDREVVVLGDMNDTEDSAALQALTGPRRAATMVDATATLVPEGERYSYVYDGRSELIDHIVVTPGLVPEIERAGVRHGNADLPAGEPWDSSASRGSDHDSPYLWLHLGHAVRPTTATPA